jgi:DnaJ-class molecular chaperone
MKTPYDILGVARNASEEEIKEAWKAKALELHPDKGGSKEAFQEAREAFNVLKDPQRRAEYDATGRVSGDDAAGPADGGGGIDLSQIFGNIFRSGNAGGFSNFPFPFGAMPGAGMGGNGPPMRRPKGDSVLHEIGIPLSDLYHGKTGNISIHRDELCKGCAGKGGTNITKCTACGGRGVTILHQRNGNMIQLTHVECGVCQRRGEKAANVCKECNGRCVVNREKVLSYTVEPGMKEGDRIILESQCSESPNYDQPGDIILLVRPATTDPMEWNRQDDDLHYGIELTWAEAILGWERDIPNHPSGKPLHILWTGGPIREGEILRIPGWGMPRRGQKGVCGDLRFVCRIRDQQGAWSEEQQRALRQVWPDWKPPVSRTHTVNLHS